MELSGKAKILMAGVLGFAGLTAVTVPVFEWAENIEAQQFADIAKSHSALISKTTDRAFDAATTSSLTSQVRTFANTESVEFDAKKNWAENLKTIQFKVDQDRGKSAGDLGEGVRMDSLRNGYQALLTSLSETVDRAPLIVRAPAKVAQGPTV